MCPDIETFAPLIQATFGAGEVVDDEFEPLPEELRPTDLRVRLADRSLRQTNPVLGVVAQLIDLAGRRLTASDVLDLADREPVRRRFRLRRRGPRAHPRLGRRQRHPLGPRRGPSRPVQAAGHARRHLAGGPRPRARRRDDDRGGPPPVRGRPARRRRREPRHRPRRPHGRARRPAAGGGRRLRHRQADRRVGAGARRPPPTPSPPPPSATPGSARSSSASSATSSARPPTRRSSSPCSRSARCSPSGCRAAPRARTSAPAT